MARLEKRRMTESANNSSNNNRRTPSTVIVNGLQPTHTNTNNEIENLLFKQEQDPTPQQFSVTLPENILLNHQITNSIAHFSTPVLNKRPRSSDDPTGQLLNGPLSPNKKMRLDIIDATKLPQTSNSSSGKSSKKNRNKQQQQQQTHQQSQPQTIIKTAASGIFPQQPVGVPQHIEESSDDVRGFSFWMCFVTRTLIIR